MFRYQPRSLREKLYNSYPATAPSQQFESAGVSMKNFTAVVSKWLKYANTPYRAKLGKGIYYPEDYIKLAGNGENMSSIVGMSNPNYWDMKTHSCLFIANEGHTPNQSLNAFFDGPTMAECASTLQACVYRAIEEMVGTDEFNRVFGTALSRFLINPILFDKIHSADEMPDVSLEKRSFAGNPLFFLFDKMESFSEADVNPGDIIYIKGVEKYADKHLSGSGNGWNVICVGKNQYNENLYLGFGPESFQEPLTYGQIKSLLIKYYNAEQLVDTRNSIQHFKRSTGNQFDLETMLNNSKATLAEALSNDQVGEAYPIVGSQYLIRLNTQRLEKFLSCRLTSWHTQQQEALESEPQNKSQKVYTQPTIRQVAGISTETLGKSFADYHASTPAQQNMLDIAQKFAAEVCRERSVPAGLVMTGMAGIGKTHLSIAVAEYASQRGKNVVFVDENIVGDLYQKIGEQRGDAPSDAEMKSYFRDWLSGVDLIIMDDINSKFGIGAKFLKAAVHYSLANNKALIITGNQPMLALKEFLPDHIGYDDLCTNSFLVLQDIKGVSHRQTWWTDKELASTSGKAESNGDMLDILAKFGLRQPAGIIIEEKNIDLISIANKYAALCPNKDIKIRILDEPFRNQIVYDYYLHDASDFDVFVLKVDGQYGQSDQLLNVISQVHDMGKRLIVVTNNEASLQQDVAKRLSYKTESKQRLEDRMKNILLGKADWHEISLKQPNTSKPTYQTHEQPNWQPTITVGPKNPPVKHDQGMTRHAGSSSAQQLEKLMEDSQMSFYGIPRISESLFKRGRGVFVFRDNGEAQIIRQDKANKKAF